MHTMAYVIPVVWLVKSCAYRGIFRFRTIPATALNCLVIAGAPILLSIIPLPGFLSIPASIGVAIYLTMRYTGVDLLPDGLCIPLGVEIVFAGALWLVQVSGIVT